MAWLFKWKSKCLSSIAATPVCVADPRCVWLTHGVDAPSACLIETIGTDYDA